MRTEKFNLCKSTKKLLTLITLLTLGVGQMWAGPTFSGGYAYFENKGGWSDASKQLCIGKGTSGESSYTETRDMTVISNTKLWYNALPGSGWGDATYMAVIGNSSGWGSGKWGTSNLSNATHRTGAVSLGNWGFGSGNVNMLTPDDGNNDATLSLSYVGNAYSSLNATVTIRAKVSTNGGSTYSNANTPGQLTASSKVFTSYTSCAGTTGASATLTAGSSSTTLKTGYTANTSVTAASVTGYDFVGWYEESTKILNSSSGTMNPHGEVTLYAYYKVKQYTVSYGVNSSTRWGSITLNSGSAVTTTGSSTLNYGTSISFTASPNSGYQVEGWYSDASCTAGNRLQSGGTSYNAGTLSEAKTVYVKFAVRTGGVVTLNAGTGGQVSLDNSTWGASKTKSSITTNTAFNIYARPNSGYTFNTWTKNSGSGTVSTNAASGAFTPVAYEDATVTASFTETKITLTPTVNYDHGTSTYTASSSNTVGVATTTNLSCSAPTAAHYTFAGWTLTNLTVTSGNAATDRNITVKINDPNGATPAAVANYNEVLTTDYVLKGGSAFGGTAWTTEFPLTKKSGHSTESVAYYTASLSSTNASGGSTNFNFKIINGANWYGLDGDGDWYYYRSSGQQTMGTSNQNIQICADVAGDYEIKVDYSTPASPKITVTFPPSLSWTATSVYSGASTLTASVSNVVSGKSIKYDVYAGATATGDIIATYTHNTSSTTDSHAFSITPSFGANESRKQYTVKITYNGTQTATYTGYIGRKWDLYVHDVQSWGMMKVHMWNAAGSKSTYPGDACSLYNGSTSWYTVTLDGQYTGFVLSANGNATKTADHALEIATYPANAYYYVDNSPGGYLQTVSITDPTVTLSVTVTSTNQINLTGFISNFGGDGSKASEMKEVYFKVNNIKDAASITASTTDGNFTKTLNNPTPDNTNNNLQAFAENIHGTGSSSILKFTRVTLDNQSATSAGTANVLAVNGAAMASGASAPAKTGYAFGGYYQSTGGADKQYYNASMGSANNWDQTTATKTIYAKWTPITYYVNFSANGGSGDAMSNQSFTYDEADDLTANTYTRTGYTFDGWATSAGGTKVYDNEDEVINLSSTANAVVPLFAHWAANNYTVTLDLDEAHKGTIAGKTESQSVTYDAATTTVPLLPTAENGYGLEGYYTEQNGAGTKVIDYDGKWIASVDGYTDADKKWVHDGNVTLYAYYKKAEITGITFSPRTTIEPGATVTVTPTISPTPVDPVIVCWRVLYNNDNPLSPQPTFTPVSGNTVSFPAHEASGTYKLEATLRTGAACGSGTVLDTYVATFHVAGDHSVTILYQDASGNTIKASESVIASAIDYTDFYITAPDIFGYTFSQWNAYDGVKIKDSDSDEKDESEIQTIKIRAIYDGRLVAKYTQKSMIYFKNTLGWEDVYVNFYSSTEYTWNASNGSGNAGVTNRNKHMTQIDDTDIWYYDYGEASITPERFVSFTSADQSNASNFWASNPGVDVVYPTRYMDALNTDKSSEAGFKAATPMFVPLAGQTPTILNSANNGKANYYNRGYWTKYTPGTGYTLEIYNSEGNSLLKSVEFTSEDELMPMKAVVDLEAGATYKYQLRRGGTGDNGIYYGNSGTMTYNEHGQTNAWEMINTMSPRFSMCGITTNAAGNYTFNLSYSANASSEYRLRMAVDYPIASGDYRVVYKDNVCTQSKASAIVTKENNGKDTVSFFIRPGQTPVMKIQQSTVNGTTGAITWSNYSTITSSISSLSKDSVYNICLTMNESGAISVEKVEVYTGNYYIRTDAANSKWDNYRSDPDHLMTYSEYSINHGGYSHYYCHWVDKNDAGRKNVKFCIANDYSPSISDTLIRETASGTWANINNYIESNGDLKRNANVRFMWNRHDNTISRAYVDGAQDDLHAFLELISGDSKIRNAETEVIMSEVTFTDKENWLYEADIQAQPNAQIKLKSTWGESNVIEQYFKGSSTTTEALIGGSGSTWYDIRLLYDFKTNRLVAAYKPSGNITDATAINADIMFIREHQGDISQLTFSGSGTITDIKTAYGVIRFNKWILNNMEPSGNTHPVLAEPKSLYERSLFWISFPFRVKLSEVFGFGTYGSHWAIQYYDGADRAARGHFLENGTFWKWLNRSTAYLEPNQGYLLAIDVDLLGINSDVWGPNSRSEQIELYFPSTGTMPNLTSADVVQTIPEHTCSINRAASEGLPDTGDPRTSYNRTIFDSHWNVLSVPTYVNTNNVTFANTDWTTEGPGKRGPNFLYTWNSDDNTITATAARGYTYHAMHSYMVQYCNTVTWAAKSGSPYTIVARKTYEEAPREIEFRLEIQQNEKMIDRTYVVLSNDEEVSANFAFGEDMVKEFNARKAAIFNYTADNVGVAGNTMPMSEQTTVIPVGLEIPTAGEYTFAIPDGTEGIGVILVDNVANTRTNLSALDYTVNLTTGTHDGRFVLEISPIHNATTGIEAVSDEGLEITGARKMIIDQKLYIVKDGKLFDATGKRVE